MKHPHDTAEQSLKGVSPRPLSDALRRRIHASVANAPVDSPADAKWRSPWRLIAGVAGAGLAVAASLAFAFVGWQIAAGFNARHEGGVELAASDDSSEIETSNDGGVEISTSDGGSEAELSITVDRRWRVTPVGDARFQVLAPNAVKLRQGELHVSFTGESNYEFDDDAPSELTIETTSGRVTARETECYVGAHDNGSSQSEGVQEMKPITRVLVLAGMVTLANQLGSITGEANSLLAAEPEKVPAKEIVQANTSFAVDLYRRLAEENKGENLFLSPYSVSIALSMAAEGARGETAEEMGRVLHFPAAARRIGDDAQRIPWQTSMIHTGLAALNRDMTSEKNGPRPVLKFANAMWGETTYPFRPEFTTTISESYKTGGVFPCNFIGDSEGERKKINKWVGEQTGGEIRDLLPDGALSPMTRLVLTNAVFFKGDWLEPFDEKDTSPREFHTADGQTFETPTMADQKRKALFAHIPEGVNGIHIAELPYNGERLSMVLIAPGEPEEFSSLESALTDERLARWLKVLRPVDRLIVTLPKFKLKVSSRLSSALKHLGMKSAFLAEDADFTGINLSDEKELFIAEVFHQAMVEVNEVGTKAAAATGVEITVTNLPPSFRADRPFIFLIRDQRTGVILFMGRVTDPRKG